MDREGNCSQLDRYFYFLSYLYSKRTLPAIAKCLPFIHTTLSCIRTSIYITHVALHSLIVPANQVTNGEGASRREQGEHNMSNASCTLTLSLHSGKCISVLLPFRFAVNETDSLSFASTTLQKTTEHSLASADAYVVDCTLAMTPTQIT